MFKPLRARQLPAWLLLATSIVLVTACISSNRNHTADPQPLPTTTVKPDPQAQAEAAIRIVATAWHYASVRLTEKPDTSNADMGRYLTGELLTQYRHLWETRLAEHLVARPASPSRAAYRIMSVSVDGDAAEIHECAVDDGVLVNTQTGAVVNDAIDTVSFRTTAVKSSGVWKLSSRAGTTAKGVTGCALQH